MVNAVVPLSQDRPATFGWLQLEKKAAKELETLAIRSPAAMGTLVYMINRMSRSNALVVSQKAIAKSLGISLKSVGNSVKLLTSHNFIQTIKVGNTSVYVVNSRVAWQGERGARYASFGADVIALENEQDSPIDESAPPLKAVPLLRDNETVLVGNDPVDTPDQGGHPLP